MGNTPTVGVVGVGIMGSGMARNLLADGLSVVVCDVDPDRVDALVDEGAEAADTPAAVARATDVVISSVPEGEHVRAVALGEGGLIDAEDADYVYADMSTVGPSVIREVAEALVRPGVTVVDAPVSGGQAGADDGTLHFMVGCDGPVPDELEPVFEAMGTRVTHVGGLGAGQVAKVGNNMASAVAMVGLCEALVFAEKAGVDQRKLVEAMTGSTGESWVLRNRADAIIDHDFEPGFKASYMYKDLRIAMADAQAYGAPVPAGSTTHELFKSVETMGKGDRSPGSVITVLEELAGLDGTE